MYRGMADSMTTTTPAKTLAVEQIIIKKEVKES